MLTVQIENSDRSSDLEDEPETCPICKKHIVPIPIYSSELSFSEMEVIFKCNNSKCKHLFISSYEFCEIPRYEGDDDFYYVITKSEPISIVPVEINSNISNISKYFYTIYQQASEAERYKLDEIAGMGYRKALEFLIKDYCISIIDKDTEKEEKEKLIKKKSLGNVIKEDLKNAPKIQSCATRASWLGNDEAHYVRKWEGKDIKDLKILIDLTVHHIDSEILTAQFEADMD